MRLQDQSRQIDGVRGNKSMLWSSEGKDKNMRRGSLDGDGEVVVVVGGGWAEELRASAY